MKKRLISLFITVVLICSCLDYSAKAAFSVFNIYLCGIIDSDGMDRTGWQTQAESWLSNIPNSAIYKKTAFNKTQLATYLKSSNMFVIHTHGSQYSLRAVDSNGNITRLYTNDILGWSSTAMSVNKLAFIGACSCGAGGSTATNIVTSLFSRGSKCVIGYLGSVNTYCNYLMIESFCTAIGAGYTISEALIYADSCVLSAYGYSGGTASRLTMGNTGQRLATYILPLSSPAIELENIEEYAIYEQYYCNDTDTYVTIYNKRIGSYNTDDYAYVITDRNGKMIISDQPHRGCLDEFNPDEEFLNYCDKEFSVAIEKYGGNYKIEEQRIIGTKDNPGMRYIVKITSDDCESIEQIDVYWR